MNAHRHGWPTVAAQCLVIRGVGRHLSGRPDTQDLKDYGDMCPSVAHLCARALPPRPYRLSPDAYASPPKP